MLLRRYLLGLLVVVIVISGYFFGGYLARRQLQVEVVPTAPISTEIKTEVLGTEEEVVVESKESEAVNVYETHEESYGLSSSSESVYQEDERTVEGLQSL